MNELKYEPLNYAPFDPYHDVDECKSCHEAGEHEQEREYWARGFVTKYADQVIIKDSCMECVNEIANEEYEKRRKVA